LFVSVRFFRHFNKQNVPFREINAMNSYDSIKLKRTLLLKSMNNKGRFALVFGLVWGVSGWVCIDWVLNYAVYRGMTELWLIQIPFTAIDVVTSPWQAYFL